MRIRSAICGFLILVLLCMPFQAGAETLDLSKSGLKVINSLAFAGLKKDLVIFPDDIEYIADDAFLDAAFAASGKTGSYAYHWCISHGISWTPTETTQDGRVLDKELNYSGRTTWQRFVQKYYLKATVRNNKLGPALFEATTVKYNIRMTFHIDEIFNKVNPTTRLNMIRILVKGWNGPDEDDNSYRSFQTESTVYEPVFEVNWTDTGAYNYNDPNQGLVYDEEGKIVDLHEHLDLRPLVWDGAVISINTGNNTLSVYHPGDLERDYTVYDLKKMNEAGYIKVKYNGVVTQGKTQNLDLLNGLLIDPRTNQPYKKLRVKITASFNDTCRIAFHESEIDNVFVNVVDRD